jgi:hypothetical protein
MPAFDASAVVESLDWDFTGKLPGEGNKRVPGWPKELYSAKGVITEPSDAAIGAFLDGLKQLYQEAQKSGLPTDGGDVTAEQMLEAVSGLTGDKFVEFMAGTAELFAGLCGGHPTKAQLLLLPMRVRVKFYAWLQQEVVNPEAGTGAGTEAVITLPSARAG